MTLFLDLMSPGHGHNFNKISRKIGRETKQAQICAEGCEEDNITHFHWG